MIKTNHRGETGGFVIIQTITTTQVDFCNTDSISSRASSVLPEVTAASSEVVGPKTPQNMVDRIPCTSNKKSDKRKREKENSKKKKTPRADTEMDTFMTMQKESVLLCDASLRE